MLSFDWTINVSEIGAAIAFLFGIGIFMGKITSFMKESSEDRRRIWSELSRLVTRIDYMHSENQELLRTIIRNEKSRRGT